jgi:aminoglycoside phosphotransferase (APT) family kinase protein
MDNPTIDVREGEQLDLAAVDTCLRQHIDGLEGEPKLRQYASGNSNLTYMLEYANRDLVLRRPPFGTIAKSAHSMHREYRIMNALKPVYAAVPTTLFHSDDEAIIGCEFYVMDKVDGVLIKDRIPAQWGFTPERTGELCTAIFDKFIELHQVDYQAIGLQDFGRPEGYIERQVKGWSQRYENALTSDVPDLIDVRQWLEDKQPGQESGHAILHGDFRIDNVMLNGENPLDVMAVLDWEISALGDPLMDLGNTLAYWVQDDDPEDMKGLMVQPSNAPGMLTRQQLLEYYASKTGANIDNFDFYLVYGYFRNAVILQQIYYRYFHGQTSDQRFAFFGAGVAILGERCRRLMAQSSL